MTRFTLSDSNTFRTWREGERLTLEEISDLAGVSVAMLSRAERGQRRFSRRTKLLMARRLGVPVRALFGTPAPPVRQTTRTRRGGTRA